MTFVLSSYKYERYTFLRYIDFKKFLSVMYQVARLLNAPPMIM